MSHRVSYITFVFLLFMAIFFVGCRSSRPAVKNGGSSKDTPSVVLPQDMAKNMRYDQRLLIEEALTWLGTPYRYGGKTHSGTDCSGLTMEVYRKALDISLPRSSREQQKFCKSIKKSSLDAGDLIFFSTGRDKTRVSHVGMYIGDSKFIHASGSRGVIVSDINERYYERTYHSSGHVARASDKDKKRPKGEKKPEADPVMESTPGKYEITLDRFLELNERQNQIDEAIEAKVDSIYSSFID